MSDKALQHLASDLGARALQSAVSYTLARVRANARPHIPRSIASSRTSSMYYQRDGKTISFRGKRRRFPGGKAMIITKRARTGHTRTIGYYGRYDASGGHIEEKKFLDTFENGAAIGSSNTWNPMFENIPLIAQGVTEVQRVGRKAFIKNINLRYYVELPHSASSAEGDIVRVALVWDKQANGVQAIGTDIWEDGTALMTFRNLVNVGRFVIMYDRVHPLNILASHTTTGSFPLVRYFHYSKKCNIPIEYSGATGAITERKSNNIFVIAYTNTGIATLRGLVRIRFTD